MSKARQIRILKREWRRAARYYGQLIRWNCAILTPDVWRRMEQIETKIADLQQERP
jgi:hypothetical protein